MRAAALLCLTLLAGCASLPKLPLGVPLVVVWGYGPGPTAYRELLIIDKLGPKGWVYAHSPGDDTVWACQLNNAVSITPFVPVTHTPDLYQSRR